MLALPGLGLAGQGPGAAQPAGGDRRIREAHGPITTTLVQMKGRLDEFFIGSFQPGFCSGGGRTYPLVHLLGEGLDGLGQFSVLLQQQLDLIGVLFCVNRDL